MGLPARKLETAVRGAGRERSSHVRLLSESSRPRQAASGKTEAACQSLFQVTLVTIAVLSILGLTRVALSAKAAEASIDQLELERSIKAESRVADRLELDKSLLVTPSRIESIAVGMSMTKAASIRYLPLTETTTAEAAVPGGRSPVALASLAGGDALGNVLSVALEVTRKEASALLVGDAAVAAAR